MSLIINPGSGPVDEPGDGWTNTYETALAEAHKWLDRMTAEGLRDIELIADDRECREGRWTFGFRHRITGVVVTLETPGIDNMAAFMKSHIFGTRVYWRGSSCSDPHLTDWAADGFEAVQTFRPCGGAA